MEMLSSAPRAHNSMYDKDQSRFKAMDKDGDGKIEIAEVVCCAHCKTPALLIDVVCSAMPRSLMPCTSRRPRSRRTTGR